MLVKDQKVTVKINNSRKWYESLGYNIEPDQIELKVKAEHLPKSSPVTVDFYCDECEQVYQKQRRSQKKLKRDLCKECRASQAKENFKEESIKIYGMTKFECHKRAMRKRKQGYKRCIPIQKGEGVIDKYSGNVRTYYYTIMKLAK